MQNFPQQGFYLYYCMNCIIMWWQMSLQVWRMLQKPLCGNQMNLATLIDFYWSKYFKDDDSLPVWTIYMQEF